MWIIAEWQHISQQEHVKRLEKCCISNAVDVTDDDRCEMAVKRVGLLVPSCEEDEGTGCEDGDSDTDW